MAKDRFDEIIKRIEILEDKFEKLDKSVVKKRKELTAKEKEKRAKENPDYKEGHDISTVGEEMGLFD